MHACVPASTTASEELNGSRAVHSEKCFFCSCCANVTMLLRCYFGYSTIYFPYSHQQRPNTRVFFKVCSPHSQAPTTIFLTVQFTHQLPTTNFQPTLLDFNVDYVGISHFYHTTWLVVSLIQPSEVAILLFLIHTNQTTHLQSPHTT